MSNNLKLKIENFQIIKKAEFEFEKGINLIVGPSGNGKTSSLRAIRTLLLNSSGSQKFIRHGAETASVLMEYNNNLIEWKRTKSGSKYTINGQEYSKLGTSNLTKVLENNGFVIDDKNDILNLEGAWQVLFPYDKSDAELFKLFENIFCVSDSGKIFQTFKTEEDRLNKELAELNSLLNKNNIKIRAIENLQEKVNLDNLKMRRTTLIDLINNFSNIKEDIMLLGNIESYLSVLPKKEKVVIFSLDNLKEYQKVNKDYLKVCSTIRYIKLLKDANLKTKYFKLDSINSYLKLSKEINFIYQVDKYPVIKTKCLVFTKDNLNKYTKLEKDINTIKNSEKFIKISDNLKKKTFDNSLIIEYNSISSSLESLKNLSNDIKILREKKETVEEQIADINEKLSKYGKCEYCGSVIGQ